MQFFSKAQFNMFKQVSLGFRKVAGLTQNQAAKDIKGKTTKGLPARKTKKKSSKKKKY